MGLIDVRAKVLGPEVPEHARGERRGGVVGVFVLAGGKERVEVRLSLLHADRCRTRGQRQDDHEHEVAAGCADGASEGVPGRLVVAADTRVVPLHRLVDEVEATLDEWWDPLEGDLAP